MVWFISCTFQVSFNWIKCMTKKPENQLCKQKEIISLIMILTEFYSLNVVCIPLMSKWTWLEQSKDFTLDGCSVNSSSSVRNLGVLFNSNLSFDSHVSSICKTAFFHLKNISKLRPMLSMSNAEILIHAFMTSRLDYCNALLGGCSARLINKLQMVQNAAAKVLTTLVRFCQHCTGSLLNIV